MSRALVFIWAEIHREPDGFEFTLSLLCVWGCVQAKELVGKMLCKDPRQRISAMGCVEHAWVTEALDEPLPATFTRLKNYQLKKKWKRGVRVAEAAECFGHLGH